MRNYTKYGNRRVEVDGFLFDSKREADRYGELKLLERAGEITGLVVHPRYDLTIGRERVCAYAADFSYVCGGELVVEDVKGVRTPVYRLKKKLMKALMGIEVREV